ncbi:MAG: DUF1460 domain-containing protein [Prevotellaceae bacterium]|nr:DUF1460 domain-containing protein [Prevotellaceae bacterium]
MNFITMRLRRSLLFLAFLPAMLWAGDSLRVAQLLCEGAAQSRETNLMLFYARELEGVPYVAHTLEVNKEEQLVVNLHELDCTTFVEVCVALTLTTWQGSTLYEDFCQNLLRIRYRQGILSGYASRNHYFSQWISSNQKLGIAREISSPASLFSATREINLHYMSDHPSAYPMLAGDPSAQGLIRQYEQESSGVSVRYIPRERLQGDQSGDLGAVHDGDILAIVTSKDGLDISHLGLAVWDSDGKLHLLNASQIHRKVVLEPMTLHTYMGKHPSQLGIRVIRIICQPEK